MKRTRLRPLSAKKRREIKVRQGIIRDRCELVGHSTCSGPIEKHEIVRRSQSSTAATDERLIIGLCRRHHGLDQFKDTAIELGIRIDPHEWRLADEIGQRRLLHGAERKRAQARGDVPRDAA